MSLGHSLVTVLIVAGFSTITSFVGSFLCFMLWVHFDLEHYWEEQKYARKRERLRKLEKDYQDAFLKNLTDEFKKDA